LNVYQPLRCGDCAHQALVCLRMRVDSGQALNAALLRGIAR